MATFNVPPRMAFSEPISGSSLSVSQTMSLGSVTGPAGTAATGAGFAASAAKIEAPPAGSIRLANTMAVKSFFIVELPSFLLVFGVAFRIERFAHRLADEDNKNQRNRDGRERRERQPQLIAVLRQQRLIDQAA